MLGGVPGCARSGEELGDAVDMDDDDRQTPDSSNLGLQSGMKIGLGSTEFAGLASRSEVDPDEPGGGRLVTIDFLSLREKRRRSRGGGQWRMR